MRAKEFISEDKVSAIPKLHVPPINSLGGIEGVSQFYGLYRMMIVAAGHPTEKNPVKSVIGEVPVAMPFTDHDKETLIKSAKRMGGKMNFVTTDGSYENDGTNTKSPIPQNSGKGILRK